jgi:hypothetical protein
MGSGTDTINIALNAFENSTTPPSTAGYLTATSATFQGASGAASYPLVIRPENPTGTHASGSYTVPYYAETSVGITTAGSGTTRTVKIQVSSATVFDVNKFDAPGIIAIVNSSGSVVDIQTYRDFEYIPTSNRVEFYEVTSLSGFTTATTPTGATSYIYYLPGTALAALDVYAIGQTIATGTPTATGFSLLPTYETYPLRKFNSVSVGRISGAKLDSGVIKADIVFYGRQNKSAAVRLDRCVKQLVQDINAASGTPGSNLPYAEYIGPTTFMLIHPFVGSVVGTTSAYTASGKDYSWIGLHKSATGATFDTDITLGTSPVNQSEKVYFPNGLIFSKQYLPEEVPVKYVLNPKLIGSDAKPITKVLSNNDNLYVFKKDEGIFRVEIAEGTDIPEVSAVVLIDNTVWPVQDDAFAECGESIYFLSNKGVTRLNNNSIQVLTGKVECKIRDLTVLNASDSRAVKAFSNDFLKQVGFYFPSSKETWVFDIEAGKWSKWVLPFDSSFTDNQNRTLFGTRGYADTWPTIRRNSYLGKWLV